MPHKRHLEDSNKKQPVCIISSCDDTFYDIIRYATNITTLLVNKMVIGIPVSHRTPWRLSQTLHESVCTWKQTHHVFARHIKKANSKMESYMIESYSEQQHFSEDFSHMAKENITECHTVLKRTGLQDFVQKSLSLQNTVHKIKQKLVISRECTIRDFVHKCLVLQQSLGRASLVAIFLQDANSQREEKITMSVYTRQNLDGRNKQLVTLELMKRNLYLSCSLGEGGPQLCLETNNNVGELNNSELQRFIFMKFENGSTSSFESAACPGWYISTSQKENDLVQMMPESDQIYFKDFLIFH